ncbi:MAG: bacteriohemerythrin [Sedimenticola sp.]
MSQLIWTPDLDTGISVIDKQHQRIVEYINQLNHAQHDASREEVGEVLNQLVDYTLSHFTFEEELMEESGYRFVKAHKKVHKLFVRRVSDYVERFKVGEDITEELLASLRTWLINHIKNDDNDYSEIVRENMGDDGKSSWLSRSMKKIFG